MSKKGRIVSAQRSSANTNAYVDTVLYVHVILKHKHYYCYIISLYSPANTATHTHKAVLLSTCWAVSLPDSPFLSWRQSASCWCWGPSTPWSHRHSSPTPPLPPGFSDWRQLHETETTCRWRKFRQDVCKLGLKIFLTHNKWKIWCTGVSRDWPIWECSS